MISATEARELYEASGKEVENWIESKVKPLVVDAATAGNRYVCIYIDSIEKYREVPKSDNEAFLLASSRSLANRCCAI